MKIILTPHVRDLLAEYVGQCPAEIGGMGKAERTDSGDFRVTDLMLLPQVVTGSTTDITSEALAKMQIELIERGEGDSLAQWCVWWHSHVNMGVFWSGTDVTTIDASSDHETLVSIVTNKRGEYKARVDIYRPIRCHLDCDVEIEEPGRDPDIVERVRADIAEKVEHRTYTGMGYGQSRKREKKRGRKSRRDMHGHWYHGKYYPYTADGYADRTPLLPYADDLDTLESGDTFMREWAAHDAEREALLEQLTDAKQAGDPAAIQAAERELAEHATRGRAAGYAIKDTA